MYRGIGWYMLTYEGDMSNDACAMIDNRKHYRDL